MIAFPGLLPITTPKMSSPSYDMRKERPLLGAFMERVRAASNPHYDEVGMIQ